MNIKTQNEYPLRFRYEDGKPSPKSSKMNISKAAFDPIGEISYIYASIEGIRINPISYIEGVPEWKSGKNKTGDKERKKDNRNTYMWVYDLEPNLLEVISLGFEYVPEHFVPVVEFGLADNGIAGNMAYATLWLNDGTTDYYGPYARPNTIYDYKIKLDFNRREMTAWVCCRGDDKWFMLVEKVSIKPAAQKINTVRVEQYPDGPEVKELLLVKTPDEEREKLKKHPSADTVKYIGLNKRFRFQSMRSLWRKPGKHVTVYRDPVNHAGFPELAKAGPRHLVCGILPGSHTGGRYGSKVLSHSFDSGLTWTKPVLFNKNVGMGRIQMTKDGKLVLFGCVSPEVKVKGIQGQELTYVMFFDSDDQGMTWSNARCLDTKTIGPGLFAELLDGSWIFCASNFFKSPKIGEYTLESLEFLKSKDKGYTWEHLSGPIAWPPYSLSEPSTLELKDGRLLVYARESRTDGMPGAKGYSCDGGKTWQFYDLPFPITGRTTAGFLDDGRVLLTFRSTVGRAALWAWIGSPEDMTGSQPVGIHYNDIYSVGLRDGELHIENEGRKGQFTMYSLRPADSRKSEVELEFEVKVQRNDGMAASVSIPFGGILRIYPDHVVMKHDKSLKVLISSGQYHKYRVECKLDNLKIYLDGKLVIDTDKGDSRCYKNSYYSRYGLAFGNEPDDIFKNGKEMPNNMWPHQYPDNITIETTGYSIWKEFNSKIIDPDAGTRTMNWCAKDGCFPDQYQLDNIIEIDASITGNDQGYSDWVQMEDGSVFLVNYTDDTSSVYVHKTIDRASSHEWRSRMQIPWIRGTIIKTEDLIKK